jgi:zinc protease
MQLKKVTLFLLLILFFNFNVKPLAAKDFANNGMDMVINNVKKIVLENGMTVLIFKNKSVPKVLVQIAYDVGSYVEQAGERGLAHLIEHMIFKGTEKLSETDISAISKKYGATNNAFTAHDKTAYFFEVDKNNWQHFVPVLADCMQNARFDEQHLASELLTVIQELKMYKDNYQSVAFNKMCELVFPAHHPYHNPIIGYKEDLANLFAQDLKNFYKKYYGPRRATLFIVGDVDLGQAEQVARENFESIKNENTFDISSVMFPQVGQEIITHQTSIYENVQKEQQVLYWVIPGLKEKKDVLVSVLSFILGRGQGSRLHKRLVDEEKIAAGVGVADIQLMHNGLLGIFIEPLDGKSEQCKQVVVQEIGKLIVDGVTEQELQKVIKTEQRVFFEKMQRLHSFTYEWIDSYFATKDELDIFKKLDEYLAIDSEQIQEFAIQYLDSFYMGQIQILPLPEDKKEYWEQAKNYSDQLDKQIISKHERTVDIEEPEFVNSMKDPSKLEFVFPKPDRDIELENGLRVLICKNGMWPILSLTCLFKEATYFSKSKESVALDLVMSMLIEGSDGYSKDDNVKFLEQFGANSGFSGGGGYLSCLSQDSKPLLERFFHILTKPSFPQDSLEKLKNIFSDDLVRSKDEPISVAFRLLNNLIYKKAHPYHWTFDDVIELLNLVEIEKLKEQHEKYVNPRNMILTVVGNFDINQMEQNVRNVFGGWSGGEYIKHELEDVEFKAGQSGEEKMLRDQLVLALGQASNINIYHPDRTALKLLNTICFGGLGSRIFQLRERTGLFYTAWGTWAEASDRVGGVDVVGAILTPDTVDSVQKSFISLIDEFAEDGVKQDEFDAAKQKYLKTLIDITSSNGSIANLLSMLSAYDLGFDFYDKALKQTQTLTLEKLNEVAKKYFKTEKLACVKVGRI